MAEKTKKFEVRLQSQTDEHVRIVNLRAKDAAEARAVCEEKEADLCAYQLADDELAALADAGVRFTEADEIDERTGEFHPAGRVVGPGAKNRAVFHAHHQTRPYKVVEVKEL